MKPGRAVRNLVAVFANLKLAVAIGSANYQFGFTFFVGRPLVTPETPAQLGSGFSNLSGIPRFTVVADDLHCQDHPGAAENRAASATAHRSFRRRRASLAPSPFRTETSRSSHRPREREQ